MLGETPPINRREKSTCWKVNQLAATIIFTTPTRSIAQRALSQGATTPCTRPELRCWSYGQVTRFSYLPPLTRFRRDGQAIKWFIHRLLLWNLAFEPMGARSVGLAVRLTGGCCPPEASAIMSTRVCGQLHPETLGTVKCSEAGNYLNQTRVYRAIIKA